MKRLNLETGEPFKHGDVRADGHVFKNYILSRIKKNGFYVEDWCSPKRFKENLKQANLRVKLWVEKNREQRNRNSRKHCQANPDKRNAFTAKRHAAKLQRTPPWLTKDQLLEIESFYTKAKDLQTLTGIKYHVDHIIPLQGKLVSGLHVPWNLQVIPAVENIKKSNNYEPTFENTTADVT